MPDRFMGWVRAIVGEVDDEADRRRAVFLTSVLVVLWPVSGVLAVAHVASGSWIASGAAGAVFALLPLALTLMKQGHRTLAYGLFVGGFSLIGNTGALFTGGIWSGGFAINPLVICLGAITLPRKVVPLLVLVPALFGVVSVLDLVPQAVELAPALHLAPWMASLAFCAVLVAGLVSVAEESVVAANRARQRAEVALQELDASSVSFERVQALLDALDEYVLETDENFRVTSANRAVRRRGLWGDEVVGMQLTDLFVGVVPAFFSRKQVRMLRGDATGFAVVLSRSEIANSGGFVWTATDISEVAATSEALRNAHRQASAANDAKSNFLANMSHELRTPLNAIIGYSELLSDEVEDQAALEDLARIVGAASSLLHLINGVLDLSKVESGTVDLSLSSSSLAALVEQPVAMVRPAAEAKGLELVVNLPPDQPVFTDQAKLRQVLLNLLSNAIKFTTSGSVTLTVSLWERSRLPWLRLEVADTGRGLSSEDLGVVFDPFTQAQQQSGEVKEQGTGLGLSICKAFVEMLGGQIYAESTVGTGSRFVVEVPAAELAHLTPSSTPTLALPTVEEGQCILLVDDDQEFLDLMQRVLQGPGRQVLTTPDPAQALSFADRYKPDLIVLDVAMPEMSGWSFMVRLKRTASADTPVMVVSGLLEEDVATALGSVASLTKPVPPALMRSEVERVLSETWSEAPTL